MVVIVVAAAEASFANDSVPAALSEAVAAAEARGLRWPLATQWEI